MRPTESTGCPAASWWSGSMPAPSKASISSAQRTTIFHAYSDRHAYTMPTPPLAHTKIGISLHLRVPLRCIIVPSHGNQALETLRLCEISFCTESFKASSRPCQRCVCVPETARTTNCNIDCCITNDISALQRLQCLVHAKAGLTLAPMRQV